MCGTFKLKWFHFHSINCVGGNCVRIQGIVFGKRKGGLTVCKFEPRQIKLAVVGEGTAEKDQVQYMVKQILGLDDVPHPDHAADALAAAICYVTHGPRAQRT